MHFYDPWGKAFEGGVGPEMKAADVVYSFKRIGDFAVASPNFSTMFQGKVAGIDEWNEYTQKTKSASQKIDYERPVEGLVALDDYTVQIKLVEKNPQFQYLLAYLGGGIVSRKAVETYGEDFKEKPVGTGPFAMEEYIAEQRIRFKANPSYRGRPDVNGGTTVAASDRVPHIQKIQYEYYNEPMPRWYFLQRGFLDYGAIPKEAFNEVVDPETHKLQPAMAARGFELDVDPEPSVYYYGFNMTDPVVGKNKPLRQAMSMAFDREKFIRVYQNGRGIAANGPIPPTFDCYDPTYVNPYCQFNLDAARAKMKEAEAIHGGPIPVLSVFMPDTSTDVRQEAEFFVSQMKQIGLEVQAEYNTYARFQELVDGRKVQIFAFGWLPDYPDEQTFLQLFYGKFAPDGGINSCAYINPEYDAIYERATKMERSPERLKLYKNLVSIVNEDCVWIDSFYPQIFLLRWKWVQNIHAMDYGSGFRQFYTVDFQERGRMQRRQH